MPIAAMNTKTTALTTALIIAAMSLLGAVTPAAFAQNTVSATQSNSFTADISQSQSSSGDFSESSQDQGFCLQVNQQNAAAGDDAANFASNSIIANDDSEVDCS
jgi:hypothetical protein